MDDAIQHLEQVVTNIEKRIDTLSWKIKKFERVLFSENETSHSCKMISMMANLEETCRKYNEIILLVTKHKNEQNAFTDTLQLQVNLVKSKVETLRAIMTKGRTIEL
ncbi:uncharacterized protein LOC132952084 [Metopolophium dirhodum]|uniref:uncharacterized protein LOC132952084 n=1 Tax=Metopolophium dirhodum TaxID=44670 RepID=UPI00298FE551|nr:uncharacterized protein LOC132952084 [Metopolophium dirhodum]